MKKFAPRSESQNLALQEFKTAFLNYTSLLKMKKTRPKDDLKSAKARFINLGRQLNPRKA